MTLAIKYELYASYTTVMCLHWLTGLLVLTSRHLTYGAQPQCNTFVRDGKTCRAKYLY